MTDNNLKVLDLQIYRPGTRELDVRVETADLLLRAVQMSDIDVYHTLIFGNQKTVANYADKKAKPKQKTVERVQGYRELWDAGIPFSGFAVTLKDTGKVIGNHNIGRGYQYDRRKPDGSIETFTTPGDSEQGIALGHPYWNNGYGTQVFNAAINHILPEYRKEGFQAGGELIETVSATVLRHNNPYSHRMLTHCFTTGSQGCSIQEVHAYEGERHLFRKYLNEDAGTNPLAINDHAM